MFKSLASLPETLSADAELACEFGLGEYFLMFEYELDEVPLETRFGLAYRPPSNAAVLRDALVDSIASNSASITVPSQRMTARSSAFSSSRTLPGQSYRPIAANAASDSDSSGFESLWQIRCNSQLANSTTSWPRSRNGGTVRVVAFKRIVERLEEATGLDQRAQVAMCCCYNAHVDVRAIAVHGAGPHVVILQQSQQPCLCFQRQRTDLVEKQRAFVRRFDQAAAVVAGGSDPITEQLRLDERGRNGGTVQRDQRARATRASCMQRTGDEFFAGARLALESATSAAFLPASECVQTGRASPGSGRPSSPWQADCVRQRAPCARSKLRLMAPINSSGSNGNTR